MTRDPWTYRTVEGALYSLGRPPAAQPVQPRPSAPPARVPGAPVRRVSARVDFAFSVRRSLDEDEMAVVRDHYILGARPLRGRDGYLRREQIVKKLVSRLNGGPCGT